MIYRNIAFNYVYNVNYSDDINIQIGDMNIICSYCQARRYKEEFPVYVVQMEITL